MKVSVALCTYNGEKFLAAQLASILRQSRLPDEIVVCDDNSTDSTSAIVERTAAGANTEIRFFRNERNLGSTRNFERAISLCRGDVIFLCDQDDVWMPEKIGTVCRLFEDDSRLGMVFSDAHLIDEHGRRLPGSLFDRTFQDRGGDLFWSFLRKNAVTGATMAFRAGYARLFSPIPVDVPNTIHDAWIALVIAANAEVKFLERKLVEYRQHPGQQLGVEWGGKDTDRREIYESSIAYQMREIERLEKMERVISESESFSPVARTPDGAVKIAAFIAEKREMIVHYTVRKELPESVLKRVLPVVSELRSGRYGKFSKGLASALKDIAG